MRTNKTLLLTRAIISCCLISFITTAIFAQRVTRCQDLDLTSESEELLAIYLQGNDEGIGGHGCWVHHHENGKDYVITPHSWGRDPAPGKRGLIEDAMQAITDSRNTYEAFGDLSNHLYYMLDDVYREDVEDDGTVFIRSGEAFWLIGDQCWMQSGTPTLRSSDGREVDRRTRKQTFAHEVGHCFVMKNVINLKPYYDDNHWFDESVSELLSSMAYPTYDNEHYYAREYDLDGEVFRQEYNAYVLWQYYADKEGMSQVIQLMTRLASLSGRIARLKHLRTIGFDELYHQFLFDFYKSQIQDLGGTGPIPMETLIDLRQPGEDLIDDPSPPVELISIPSERLSLYELYIPADYDLIIDPPINSSEKAFFSLLSENKNVRDWTTPQRIEGNCGSFTVVNILASHLQDDPVTRSKINYRLEERENCCEEGLIVERNPDENNLNGTFNFDYYIESEVRSDTEDGTNVVPMKYFVNSKDGSMLLLSSFFMDNFGRDADRSMKAHAVIWLANGQLAAYVHDKRNSQNRVITMDMNQTREDVMGPRAINPAEILREGRGGTSPEALPADSPWQGNSTAYAYMREERFDPGVRNKYTGYISNDVVDVSSPMSSFGFMVGYIKDQSGRGKRLVYSHYETPNGEWMDAHLITLQKMCASFDGSGYKKMTLGGYTGAVGSMSQSEREDFVDSGRDYQQKLGELLTELGRCRDNEFCQRDIKQAILDLQREHESNVYDLRPNTELTGTAGSDFQEQERMIRERMYSKQEEIIQQERRCATLNDQNVMCGGCMDYVLERCNTQLESLNDELDQLECEMARLHGAEDMMDCD